MPSHWEQPRALGAGFTGAARLLGSCIFLLWWHQGEEAEGSFSGLLKCTPGPAGGRAGKLGAPRP